MPSPVIEPVRRSFQVLEALSRRNRSTLSLLAAETGLPRPTVVRLLQTLVALGYAQRVSRHDGYRLTDRVLGLAESIRFVDHLVDAAMPHMSGFTAEHGWPLYLATLSDGALTIRHSTAPESPMSFEAAALNTRRSMLTSALGRAWLAFSAGDSRETLLRTLLPAGAAGRRQRLALERVLGQVRQEGWAFTASARPSRIHGIAVPVLGRTGGLLGSLSMRFPRSAMGEAEVAARYGRRLAAVARAIATDASGRAIDKER
jgi:IclR family mhp operon transcriptional activator